MTKKLLCFTILSVFAFLPMQVSQANIEMLQSCGSGTFGINVSNNAPNTNPIYIYGPTSDSAYIDAYSGTSMGPFDAGEDYTVIMYGNSASGSHTYVFNGESKTNSSGSATFHFDCIDHNAFGSITYNGP